VSQASDDFPLYYFLASALLSGGGKLGEELWVNLAYDRPLIEL
jgi:hypothetical protein